MPRFTLRSSHLLAIAVVSIGAFSVLDAAFFKEYISGLDWPEPAIVNPGSATEAPSDAIVLFDGTDLSAFENGDKWKVEDGVATVQKSGIQTKQSFGDIQMHVEWASPAEVKGNGQGRGNSGIYLMGRYEVQVLDSYENKTYFDGQAASIYKQKPPMVNASRPPGEWQSYDIIFEAPKFNEDGDLLKPAYLTVLHNGIVVQNHTELMGGTSYTSAPTYKQHAAKLPISIQNHGNPVRYRNIWVREIEEIKPRNGDSYQDIPPKDEVEAAATDGKEE